MAYTVEQLEGGVETEDERIDVLLPVGSHVLELVVEDSAGLRSAPAIVTITVESEPGPVTEPEPTVGFMFPFAGVPGDSILAVVFGLHLLEATSVDFPIRAGITAEALVRAAGEFEPSEMERVLSGSGGDLREGVGESLFGSGTRSLIGGAGSTFPGGLAAKTLNYLPVRLSILERAAVGEYPFTVTTPSGTDESARPFIVAAEVAAIKAALEMIPEIGTVTAGKLKENGIRDVFGFLATELRALVAILGEGKAQRTKAAAANLLLNMAVSSSGTTVVTEP